MEKWKSGKGKTNKGKCWSSSARLKIWMRMYDGFFTTKMKFPEGLFSRWKRWKSGKVEKGKLHRGNEGLCWPGMKSPRVWWLAGAEVWGSLTTGDNKNSGGAFSGMEKWKSGKGKLHRENEGRCRQEEAEVFGG